MSKSNSSNGSCGSPKPKIKGKIDPRHVKIAVLKCEGYSVKEISKKVGISEDRIYHLLADENSTVYTEIRRISNEVAEASNRHFSHLFRKVLQKLDIMLESGDDETIFRAIDRTLKIFSTMVSKNGPSVQQNFGIQVKQEQNTPPFDINEAILQKRRERGLEPPLQESETPDSPDEEPETMESPDEEPETPEPPDQEPETPDPSS